MNTKETTIEGANRETPSDTEHLSNLNTLRPHRIRYEDLPSHVQHILSQMGVLAREVDTIISDEMAATDDTEAALVIIHKRLAPIRKLFSQYDW